MVSKILLGKADHKWFVDVCCDGSHEGKCDSDNPACRFQNLICGEPYSKCIKIAEEATARYGAPIENERRQKR